MTLQEMCDVINKNQANDSFHPLTCGNNSNHEVLIAVVEDDQIILKCPDCDYTQQAGRPSKVTLLPEMIMGMPKNLWDKMANPSKVITVTSCNNCPFCKYVGGPDECTLLQKEDPWTDREGTPPMDCPLRTQEVIIRGDIA